MPGTHILSIHSLVSQRPTTAPVLGVAGAADGLEHPDVCTQGLTLQGQTTGVGKGEQAWR